MFQNDVFGQSRNSVPGFNNPVFGNTWAGTPYGSVGNQIPWHLGTHMPYQMNTQIPYIYNQLPYHLAQQVLQNCWNSCQPQNVGMNQGFLPFFGTNLPYQTTGFFHGGINQGHGNFGQNPAVGTINPFFNQYASNPWGFGSNCR